MNTAIMLEGVLASLQAIESKLKKPKPKKIPHRIEMEIYRRGRESAFAYMKHLSKEERFDIGRAGYMQGFAEGYTKGFKEAKVFADPLPEGHMEQIRT